MLLEDVIGDINLPYNTAEGIWKKAGTLVSEVNSVVPAPGCGPKDKMVKSKSGLAPHLITVMEQFTNVMTNVRNINLYAFVHISLLLQKLMVI